MNKKRGDITQIFTLIVALAILMITIIYIIKMITPFVWYQKMQNIASKYVYVIERFGYLTQDEKEELYNELVSEGFDINNISLDCPETRLEYGEMFKFELTYNLEIEYGIVLDEIKRETKQLSLHVKKYGYSKI